MKVLWITNILLPNAAEILGQKAPVIGGWMQSSANAILYEDSSLKLAIATVCPYVEELKKNAKDGITYYILPLKGDRSKYHKSLEALWRQVYNDFYPDITQIHGTEFAHGLAYLNSCPKDNVVVSIQGMTSAYYYYYYGLTNLDILRNITFRDIIQRDSLWQQKRKFQKRGEIEKRVLLNVHHIIGRTSWDKARTWAINPIAEYHFCNETLRHGFYGKEWKYSNCEQHSIFVSQAGYPIKGLHQLLKAMPLVLRNYPDTKIFVAGSDITKTETFHDKLHLSGYGLYLKRLIKELNLVDKIHFTGPLMEQEMIKHYLSSNVFICPSTIENSPNSLCEAQILGVPHIASYVGGTADMMRGNEDCLYRFEETEMLAEKICHVFADWTYSKNMQKEAQKRHDSKANAERLIDIYNTICHYNTTLKI